MGTMRALGFAELVEDGITDLEQAVDLHLTTNFFPPLRVSFTQTALEAIDAYNEEDVDRAIELPEGVEHRNGGSTMPAWQVVDNLRLEAFIGIGAEVEL